jgi:hypothetical protein
MAETRPRCPQCDGLLKYEPADLLGPERVHCILCGWELLRQGPPLCRLFDSSNKHEEKQEPSWAAAIISGAGKFRLRRLSPMSEKNSLSTLNDHLFEQLDRLSSSKGEALKVEIERTRAMAGLAKEMTENAKLALEVQRCLGGKPAATPKMLCIEASE